MVPERKDWEDKLRDLKVTELRNEKEITRAIQYTEEELRTHLQLGTADTEGKKSILLSLFLVVQNIGLGQTSKELSQSIDMLLETLTELDRAANDLVAGAEAQVAELVAELEKIQERKQAMPALSLAEITAELKRREEMRERISSIQEGLENERDSMSEQVRTFDQLLQHNASGDPKITKMRKGQLERGVEDLNETIQGIVEGLADNEKKCQILRDYEYAVRLVGDGLPEGIIGEEIDLGK